MSQEDHAETPELTRENIACPETGYDNPGFSVLVKQAKTTTVVVEEFVE
jgi:hypothetical protein